MDLDKIDNKIELIHKDNFILINVFYKEVIKQHQVYGIIKG
jgi:hypothetical protein